jgi:hypothetical protein
MLETEATKDATSRQRERYWDVTERAMLPISLHADCHTKSAIWLATGKAAPKEITVKN